MKSLRRTTGRLGELAWAAVFWTAGKRWARILARNEERGRADGM